MRPSAGHAFALAILAIVAAGPSGTAAGPGVRPLGQRVIDELSDGAVLELPAGRFRVPRGGLVVDKQITIQGANPGRNRLTSGTILVPSDTSAVITIRHEIGNITLRDLIVDAEDKAGSGIAMRTSDRPSNVTLERVTVWHATGDGIRLIAERGGSINTLVVRDCISSGNGRDGLVVAGSAFPRIEGGVFGSNGRSGVRIDLCSSARLRDVYFEENGLMTGSAKVGELMLRGGFNHIVDGCAFENFGGRGTRHVAVRVENAQGTRIDGCVFINEAGRDGGTGVEYENESRDNWLGACTWRNVTQPWKLLENSAVEAQKTQAVRSP